MREGSKATTASFSFVDCQPDCCASHARHLLCAFRLEEESVAPPCLLDRACAWWRIQGVSRNRGLDTLGRKCANNLFMLITLAGLRLEDSGFTRPKPLLLLAYLALEGSRERRFLRDLFWPGEIDAATHLRVTLQRIRDAVPGALEIAGEWVSCALRTDAQELLGAQEAGLSDRVLELYTGAFLAGANLPVLGSELEEWVYATRELLAACVQSACLQQATDHARKGAFELCAQRAERAYRLPGAPEPDGERLFHLHALLLAGESPMALEVKREAEQAGITPCASIELARAHWQRKTNRSVARLPSPINTFVGRASEIETVREHLTSNDCRWLTLLGPGGMGKTRLALETARQVAGTPAFPDGVFWVALENILETGTAAQRIHEALVGPSNATGEPISQVESWLLERSALLVLDNAEQVEGIGNLIERWSSTGTESRWLVTSRERLHGHNEWVLTLEGLPQGNRRRPNLESDAAKLFVRRSNQVRVGKTFNSEDAPAILEVCELLEGMPLALELAATWMDVIQPAELASELRTDLRMLEQNGNKAQNLRVAFDRSWNKLSERERLILASLAIFEDGFTREAAQKVTGATISDLFLLVNRSLIRATSESRYGMHPVIRSYAKEMLEGIEGRKVAVQGLHDDYFFDFLLTHCTRLTGPDPILHFSALDREINNISVAWLDSNEEKIELMEFISPYLRDYFLKNGRIANGKSLFEHSISICEYQEGRFISKSLTFRSTLVIFYLNLNNISSAKFFADYLTEDRMHNIQKNSNEFCYSYIVEGLIKNQENKFNESKKSYSIGLKIARKIKNIGFEISFLCNILASSNEIYQGKKVVTNLIKILQRYELNNAVKAEALYALGVYFCQNSNFKKARDFFEKSLVISKEICDTANEARVLNDIAHCLYEIAEYKQGIIYAGDACNKAVITESLSYQCFSFDTKGHLNLKIENFNEALQDFRQSLDFSHRMSDDYRIYDRLISISETYLKLKEANKALEILKLILEDKKIDTRLYIRAHLILKAVKLGDIITKSLFNSSSITQIARKEILHSK
jgi:predicted ATPase/tetratricopeptide (TPR) repeat protein